MCGDKYEVLLYCGKLVLGKKKTIFTIEEALERWENCLKKPKEYHNDKVNSMLSVEGLLKNFQ